jgi:exodeoxyribonuclease III
MRFRCLAYNIDGGGAEKLDALSDVLAYTAADLMALTEANDLAVIKELAGRMGLVYVWEPGSGTNHVATLSRFPIVASQMHRRPPLTQAALETKVETPAARISIYNIHFLPYLLLPFELRRWQAVGKLLSIIQQRPPGPHLILGDLNAIAPGDRVLQRRNPPRMRRVMALQFNVIFRFALSRLLRAGYVDCFRRLNPTEDGFTWMATNRTTRYDYVLADPTLALALRACRVVDEVEAVQVASDHLPLLAEFELGD